MKIILQTKITYNINKKIKVKFRHKKMLKWKTRKINIIIRVKNKVKEIKMLQINIKY